MWKYGIFGIPKDHKKGHELYETDQGEFKAWHAAYGKNSTTRHTRRISNTAAIATVWTASVLSVIGVGGFLFPLLIPIGLARRFFLRESARKVDMEIARTFPHGYLAQKVAARQGRSFRQDDPLFATPPTSPLHRGLPSNGLTTYYGWGDGHTGTEPQVDTGPRDGEVSIPEVRLPRSPTTSSMPLTSSSPRRTSGATRARGTNSDPWMPEIPDSPNVTNVSGGSDGGSHAPGPRHHDHPTHSSSSGHGHDGRDHGSVTHHVSHVDHHSHAGNAPSHGSNAGGGHSSHDGGGSSSFGSYDGGSSSSDGGGSGGDGGGGGGEYYRNHDGGRGIDNGDVDRVTSPVRGKEICTPADLRFL